MIRPQYHFRHTTQGFCAWDVRRVIALTDGLVPFQLALSAIAELDEVYWSHQTVRDVVKHAELIVTADLSFPIIVCPQGRVMDGMHRVARATMLGHDRIDAVKLQQMPQPDYVDVAPDDLPYH